VAEVLVIGVGNALRGDDAAGLEVARRVRAAAPAGITVLEHGGEPASLLELLRDAGAAVVVDASDSGVVPGTVRRIDARRGPLPVALGGASTHGIGVAEAIELGRALERLPDRLVLFCVEGEDFGPHEGLLPAVERVLDTTAEAVAAEAAALRRTPH
jgi:hydrogenase maturation protease